MDTLAFMLALVAQLKALRRTGWNIRSHEPLTLFRQRRVRYPESVAAHTMGVQMLVLLLTSRLQIDLLKALQLALVHDLIEAKTGDPVVYGLTGEKRRLAIEDKQSREIAAIEEIRRTHGAYGEMVFALWHEYHERKTDEAKIVGQLDKLEVAIQALAYYEAGEQVDPFEFLHGARGALHHPAIIAEWELLKRRAEIVVTARSVRDRRAKRMKRLLTAATAFVVVVFTWFLTR